MRIRRLTLEDAEAYLPVRRSALTEAPFSFGSSPEDDRLRSIKSVRKVLAREAVFGALTPELVGIVGIRRGPGLKEQHRCEIWGLYVAPHARRQGVARALMRAALSFARSLGGVTHVGLGVSERAPGAKALHESLGFKTWGVEPAAVKVGEVEAAEHFMVLMLSGLSG